MGDIGDLVAQADGFRATLEAAKKRIPREFDWYPYDTLANLQTMERLLAGEWRNLPALADGKPVLDVGCADGELASWLTWPCVLDLVACIIYARHASSHSLCRGEDCACLSSQLRLTDRAKWKPSR
jgi:hypothetical protein